MPPSDVRPDISDRVRRRWSRALHLVFLVTGIAFASWVSRTPLIRDLVQASTAQMGLVLLGLSVGATLGLVSAGPLVTARGGRFVVICGGICMSTGLVLIGIGSLCGQVSVLTLGLAVFGLGTGSNDVSLNVEGAALERLIGRAVLPSIHGFYSLGSLLGALIGLACNRWQVPLGWHLGAVCVLLGSSVCWAVGAVPEGTGRAEPPPVADAGPVSTGGRKTSGLLDRRTVGLCALLLGTTLAEGTANDWLPLLSVDDYGASAATGALVFAVFTATMTLGRLGGARVLDHFGRVAAVRACVVLALGGVMGASLLDGVGALVVAAAAWGVGVSLPFPVVISAAGDRPDGATARVAVVATAGYLAFLAGPPVIGLIGQGFGLRSAILIAAVLLLPALVLVRFLPRPTRELQR